MLVKNNYRLRAVEKTDLAFLKNLRTNPETHHYLGTFAFLNDAGQENWFNSLQSRKDSQFLMFDFQDGDNWTTIGMVRLSEIDHINKSVCVGGDIDPAYRGAGHARAMYDLLLDLGFNYLNMHRLWLLVLRYNERAINLYKKVGFIEEGCQRQAIYRNGTYHDYLMMSQLKSEYTNNDN